MITFSALVSALALYLRSIGLDPATGEMPAPARREGRGGAPLICRKIAIGPPWEARVFHRRLA
jgi:hypothetical protein